MLSFGKTSKLGFQIVIPCVCEAVRQVPEVAHVVEESDLVDLLHFLPHESEDPEDDDALDRRRERAALLRVPVVHQVVQEFHVKHITKELFRPKEQFLKTEFGSKKGISYKEQLWFSGKGR